MWNDAIQRSTQLVTDALLHRRVLPVEALAFERVSGVLAVRTALRLHCGPQALLFAVPEAAASTARQMLRGSHVMLVDDVVTTAATLNACAAVLHDAGARIISYVTFGRAPAIGDRI